MLVESVVPRRKKLILLAEQIVSQSKSCSTLILNTNWNEPTTCIFLSLALEFSRNVKIDIEKKEEKTLISEFKGEPNGPKESRIFVRNRDKIDVTSGHGYRWDARKLFYYM